MSHEIVPYDYYSLSSEHEFFTSFDFWDRLNFVSQAVAPEEMRESLYKLDIAFVNAVIAGDINAAYEALCFRYEATGHKIEGRTTAGDEIGSDTLGQAIEFAVFWQVDDPRLPRMEEDYKLLSIIHALENPLPEEKEALEKFWLEDLAAMQYQQLVLF